MGIVIKKRSNGLILFESEHKTMREAVEEAISQKINLRNSDLRYADLRHANLRDSNFSDSDFRYANISNANLRFSNLSSSDISCADFSDSNLSYTKLIDTNISDTSLRNANLNFAKLSNANIRNADLRHASFSYAVLYDCKNYINSHAFVLELIRRHESTVFTDEQWVIIGQISAYFYCWNDLKTKFGKKLMPIFKVLEDYGFDEYIRHYESIMD